MDPLVFVFGSFSEDEASQFQFSSDSPSKTLTGPSGVKKAVSSERSPNLTPLKQEDRGEEFAQSCCNGNQNHLADEKTVHDVVIAENGALEHEDEIVVNANHTSETTQKSDDMPGLINKLQLDSDIVESDNETAFVEESSKQVLPKSWAALLDGEANSADQRNEKAAGKVAVNGAKEVQVTELSGELWLSSLNNVNVAAKRLQPRGLINKGNLCFLTATLQALLSCSPFVHLLQTLHARGVPEAGFPTLRACVDFYKEFELQESDSHKGDRVSIDVGKPFLPSMFDNLLQSFNPDQPATGSARNRQEDAQEFLSFAMDQLHDELLRLLGMDQRAGKVGNHMALTSNEDEDWETVGPKNRTAVVRTHSFSKSALSDIFGGELYSIVKTKGSKASATVEPFLVLHLDILPEAVHTLEDALKLFAAPETLEGYKSMAGKVPTISASKSIKLQSLPCVLILHLKRFSYGPQGSNKLHKVLHYPPSLTLGRDLLANTSSTSETRNYELVATVTHHGKDPSRGHYTTHSKQLDGQWLRYDDGVVSIVPVSRVLQDQAYMLFYRRLVNML